MKTNYINPNPKKVSEVDLKAVLKEVHDRHEQQRREDYQALCKALSDGFRCVPKPLC